MGCRVFLFLFKIPRSESSQAVHDPGPHHKEGAGLTPSCLQPRLSRWKVTGRLLTALWGKVRRNYRALTYVSGMWQACAIFLKSLEQWVIPRRWPRTAASRFSKKKFKKSYAYNRTLISLFPWLGRAGSARTVLLLSCHTDSPLCSRWWWFTSFPRL